MDVQIVSSKKIVKIWILNLKTILRIGCWEKFNHIQHGMGLLYCLLASEVAILWLSSSRFYSGLGAGNEQSAHATTKCLHRHGSEDHADFSCISEKCPCFYPEQPTGRRDFSEVRRAGKGDNWRGSIKYVLGLTVYDGRVMEYSLTCVMDSDTLKEQSKKS